MLNLILSQFSSLLWCSAINAKVSLRVSDGEEENQIKKFLHRFSIEDFFLSPISLFLTIFPVNWIRFVEMLIYFFSRFSTSLNHFLGVQR